MRRQRFEEIERAGAPDRDHVPEPIVAGGPHVPVVATAHLLGRQRDAAVHCVEVVFVGRPHGGRITAGSHRLVLVRRYDTRTPGNVEPEGEYEHCDHTHIDPWHDRGLRTYKRTPDGIRTAPARIGLNEMRMFCDGLSTVKVIATRTAGAAKHESPRGRFAARIRRVTLGHRPTHRRCLRDDGRYRRRSSPLSSRCSTTAITSLARGLSRTNNRPCGGPYLQRDGQ